MREKHISVSRSARFYTLGRTDDSIEETWIVLHGYRQLARRFLGRFAKFESRGRLIVAPEGLSRFYLESTEGPHGSESPVGASWMTYEDRLTEIEDYIRFLDVVVEEVWSGFGSSEPKLNVLGFSQGVATACRWAWRGFKTPDNLILWGDAPPPEIGRKELSEQRTGMRVVFVAGNGDPYFGPGVASRHADLWKGLGRRAELISYDGGHDIDTETLLDIQRKVSV